ncbi:MAG: radical SAM protein [Planctomycetota bacterium]
MLSERRILAARPPKANVDPRRTYASLVELECGISGQPEPVATLFLTNSECRFRCLMCDLWKHTLDTPTPAGAIPEQIAHALARLPPARHIKLYNSGNFFDPRSVPVDDYRSIADLVARFETVIVENHPRLCGANVERFRSLLAPHQTLEVALGLETIHPEALAALNKRLTVEDYADAARRLATAGIAIRTFILLRPPLLDESAGVDWALRSLAFAFDCGSRVAAVIPTRTGNGIMEQGVVEGWFAPPKLRSLERVLNQALDWGRGRVLADLWDLERFSDCAACFRARRERLERLNLGQRPEAEVLCRECEMRG